MLVNRFQASAIHAIQSLPPCCGFAYINTFRSPQHSELDETVIDYLRLPGPAPFASPSPSKHLSTHPLRTLQLTETSLLPLFSAVRSIYRALASLPPVATVKQRLPPCCRAKAKPKRVTASKKCIYHCHQTTSPSPNSFSAFISHSIGVASPRFYSSLHLPTCHCDTVKLRRY